MSNSAGVTRRRAVRSGIVFATGCLAGLNVREVLAQAARVGKPPLTIAAINELLNSRQSEAFVADFKRAPDLQSFLAQYFVVSERQAQMARTTGAAELQSLIGKIDEAQRRGGKIELVDAGKFTGDVRQAKLELQGQAQGNDLRITAKELQAR